MYVCTYIHIHVCVYMNTDWGAQGLAGTARDSPESPELAVRGSDREARLCGETVTLKGLCRGSSRPG